MSDWISFNTRPPDKPFPLGILFKGGAATVARHIRDLENAREEGATHWCEINLPKPPKVETQEDRDEIAYRTWHVDPKSCTISTREAWHAALAWERTAGEAEKLREELRGLVRDLHHLRITENHFDTEIKRLAGLEERP